MRMTWGFVIGLAERDLGADPRLLGVKHGPKAFAAWANRQPDLFPDGITLTDARWILSHPEAFTDGKP